jgi:hypothetical protein
LIGIGHGILETGARDAQRLGRHRDAARLQRLHDNREAVAFGAEPVFHRHDEIVEKHRIGPQRL